MDRSIMDKELARDLHYKLIEQYDLYDCPITNSEVRDLIIKTLDKSKQYWLDKAAEVAETHSGTVAGLTNAGYVIANKIKELKE